MTHDVAARYDEGNREFLPPVRTLGFNPQLRMNDSVLAQSYVEAYDISYPEALRRIEGEVAELKQLLSEQGRYDMENLGTLTVNQEGNYEFAPGEAGVLAPDLYGLGNFNFKRLKDADAVQPAEERPLPVAKEVSIDTSLLEFTDNSGSNDDGTISVKLSWVRNAVAVAAAVVAFFLVATPVTNSDLGTQTMSQLQHHLLYKLIPQDTNIVPVEPVAPAVAKTTPVKNTETAAAKQAATANKQPAAPAEPVVKPKTDGPTYCIVVASQVKLSNAEQYVARLKQQGFPDARVFVHKNVVRVVSGEYATEAEAYRQLNKMNDKEEFYEAWVYKKTAEV